jgi:hypothetical protein
MPAAFRVFTTISRVARTEVCAGAIRVSSATGLPSARSETQEVFSARICTVKVAGGLGLAAGAVACVADGLGFGWGGLAEGLVEEAAEEVGGGGGAGWFAGKTVADAVGAVGGAGSAWGVLGAEMVADGGVAGGGSGRGDADVVGGAELDGRVAAGAGAEAGAGERLEEATAGDAAVGWVRRRKFQKARTSVTSSKAKASFSHGIGVED